MDAGIDDVKVVPKPMVPTVSSTRSARLSPDVGSGQGLGHGDRSDLWGGVGGDNFSIGSTTSLNTSYTVTK